jgi:hypothetical protein
MREENITEFCPGWSELNPSQNLKLGEQYISKFAQPSCKKEKKRSKR